MVLEKSIDWSAKGTEGNLTKAEMKNQKDILSSMNRG